MDWIQFLQIICIPAFGWIFHKVGDLQNKLNAFKVEVAKEYATKEQFVRLEEKIDDLRNLLIKELNNER